VTGTVALAVTVGILLWSLLWATLTDMFKDELRTRLGRLPYWLIRMAALRIPAVDRRTDLVEEWEAELDVILHDTEGRPLTWLVRGVSFSMDLLLRGARAAAVEMGPGRTEAEIMSCPMPAEVAALPAWSELFPEGRHIFYEGDNPAAFVRQIQAEFGFSPASDPGWGEQIDGDGMSFTSYSFHCPVEHLDEIYGNSHFPMGS
jgi:hypothetical protein